MSRTSELIETLNNENKNGGMSYNQWVTFLLTNIALSLARICDVLETERPTCTDDTCEIGGTE